MSNGSASYAEPTPTERWSLANPGNRAIHDERSTRAVSALTRAGAWPLDGRRVLDLGCGEGHGLSDLVAAGVPPSACVGLEPDETRLRRAVTRVPGLRAVDGDGAALPFADGRFDVVVAFTVFSSVLDEPFACEVGAEVARVLRPGGAVLWYDMRHPNPRNPVTRAVTRADIRRVFPDFALDLEPVTVLPPLSRRLGARAGSVYPWLAHVPALTTHLLGVLRKPAG